MALLNTVGRFGSVPTYIRCHDPEEVVVRRALHAETMLAANYMAEAAVLISF